jgi:molybdate transport system regulatory protein
MTEEDEEAADSDAGEAAADPDPGPGPDPDPAAAATAGLHAGGVTFDGDDAALLRAVAEEGSLNTAAAALGRSYSRAHKRLDALEGAFGALVERERGGAGGGGSELTPTGRALLGRFERLRAAVAGTVEVTETVLTGDARERDGELVEVATPAGPLRALVGADSDVGATDRVQVSVRADAVTLHAASDAPGADATSARNRLTGTVAAVDAGAAVATVTVDVGAPVPLSALLTVDSVERLGLAAGTAVVASFKATATRATPA